MNRINLRRRRARMAMAQTAMVPQRRLSKSSIEAPTRTQPPRPHRNRLSQCAATPQCSRRVHSASLPPHLIGWLVCDQRQPQTRRPRCHQQTHRRPRRLFQLLPCQLLPCRQCCVLHWASAINPSGAFTRLPSTGIASAAPSGSARPTPTTAAPHRIPRIIARRLSRSISGVLPKLSYRCESLPRGKSTRHRPKSRNEHRAGTRRDQSS
jgi:hypothetical protein